MQEQYEAVLEERDTLHASLGTCRRRARSSGRLRQEVAAQAEQQQQQQQEEVPEEPSQLVHCSRPVWHARLTTVASS